LRGHIAHGVQRPALAKLRADDLEDAHTVLPREPRAAHTVSLRLLDRGRAGDEQERVEALSDEAVLAEDAERRGVRTHDRAAGLLEEDPVGERDERVLHVDRRDGLVAGAPPRCTPPFRAHAASSSRMRVSLRGLESIGSCEPMRRADSRICRRPRLPRVAYERSTSPTSKPFPSSSMTATTESFSS